RRPVQSRRVAEEAELRVKHQPQTPEIGADDRPLAQSKDVLEREIEVLEADAKGPFLVIRVGELGGLTVAQVQLEFRGKQGGDARPEVEHVAAKQRKTDGEEPSRHFSASGAGSCGLPEFWRSYI